MGLLFYTHLIDGEEYTPNPNYVYCLDKYARDYVKTSRTATKGIDEKVRNYVICDLVQYIGFIHDDGYSMYPEKLADDFFYKKPDFSKLEDESAKKEFLDEITRIFAHYMFNLPNGETIPQHVSYYYEYEFNRDFDPNDGAIVVVDFLNYIYQCNECNWINTAKGLYEISQKQAHDKTLKNLRRFLENTEEYNIKLANGVTIEEIYEDLKKNKLLYSFIGTMTGKYGYPYEFFYAAYAYAKLNNGKPSGFKTADRLIEYMKLDIPEEKTLKRS